MPVTLPDVPPLFDDPHNEYAIAQTIQLAIDTIGWVDRSYHIAKVGIKADSDLTYPQIFANNDSDEHFDIRPDSKIGAYSFIEVDSPSIVDIENDEVTYSFSLVFWANLVLVDAAKLYDFTSELIEDVIDELAKLEAESIAIETRPEIIFNKYTGTTQELKQFLMKRYSGFKLSFTIKVPYSDTCGADPVDSCQQNIDRINNLPESVKNCVLASVCDGDATAVVKNSDGTILVTEEIPAGASEDIPIDDVALSNSDDSYVDSAPSGVPFELSDINVTEVDGSVAVKPSNINIVCANPGIAYARPPLTGQTTSFRTGDDAWRRSNNIYKYEKLGIKPILHATNIKLLANIVGNENTFGNFDRFTDEDGLQVYGNNYAIDHYTGLAWHFAGISAALNWNDAIDAAVADSILGFDDFYLPNRNELESIRTYTFRFFENFGLLINSIWTGTTTPTQTANAYQGTTRGQVFSTTKTTSGGMSWIAVRNHFN